MYLVKCINLTWNIGLDWKQRKGGDRAWDGWMASLTPQTWTWTCCSPRGSQSRTWLSDWTTTELGLFPSLCVVPVNPWWHETAQASVQGVLVLEFLWSNHLLAVEPFLIQGHPPPRSLLWCRTAGRVRRHSTCEHNAWIAMQFWTCIIKI